MPKRIRWRMADVPDVKMQKEANVYLDHFLIVVDVWAVSKHLWATTSGLTMTVHKWRLSKTNET